MKKIIAASLLSFAVATPALAGGDLYGGVLFGSTNASTTAIGGFIGSKVTTPALISKYNGTMSVEGHFTSLGSTSLTTGVVGFSTLTVDSKTTAFGADAVAMFPIRSVQHLSAFGKLGFAHASTKTTTTATFFGTAQPPLTATVATNSLVFGIGAQYEVDRDISVRGGYQTYASGSDAMYVAAVMAF